jgi:hypothetical protein
MRRYWWVVLAIVGVALVAVGLSLGQWTSVKRHADALCTACVGLTTEE